MYRRNFLFSSAAALGSTGALAGFAFAQEPGAPAAPDQPAPETPDEAQPEPAPKPFDFEDVADIAKDYASRDYTQPISQLTGSFGNLNYDQYRAIRFRRDRDPWHANRLFSLDLLPPGSIFYEPIEINMVVDGVATKVAFTPRLFEFDPSQFPDGGDMETVGNMGFSGFRLRTPLNRPDVMDEFAVFQGASYFRAVSRGTLYGLSARGLAIGTGSPEGEEFPLFRAFWIHEPGPQDRTVKINALLDSKSITGAFEFILAPGAETVITTRVALFPRRDMTNVGIAPLTSMYWFGPADRRRIDDYRPAVHDNDGLQMLTGAETRLWRVLSGPPTLQASAFMDNDPLGFGLAQRSRSFEDYQDAEARYDLRPSAWIAPQGRWGKGSVTLIEIPVENEFNDNIVTFWQSSDKLLKGQRKDYSYVLTFAPQIPDSAPISRVLETMSGRAINNADARTYIVDFDLSVFGSEDPAAQIRASAGRIGHNYLIRMPQEGRLRLSFEYFPENAKVADLSAVLNGPEGPLSETWIARWARE
ncbi:glucan biosynthesis protein [Paracoccus aminophilus]|uniref:Glucan biosynthesis protein G n=1 Tax=Paracoccus aminophilus JCM 7686 TaxID=1367847 RepID=S5YVS8_PARAH|nr:glucan biosynthesis protein [Paracoccus aminophilus]AGT09346.1 glucan biosynthesis protein G [Paracoccus aminophilus JCM 7686]